MGYSLSDHGLVKSAMQGRVTVARGTLNLVNARTEADVFDALGLPYVPPQARPSPSTFILILITDT